MTPPRPLPHGEPPRASTGVDGLDEILGGGLAADRLYLLEGTPGTGKTTLRPAVPARRRRRAAKRACTSRSPRRRASCAPSSPRMAGRSTASRCSSCSTRPAATRTPSSRSSIPPRSSSARHRARSRRRSSAPSPTRLVFDSLSEMRLLAQNPLRYRRQILASSSSSRSRLHRAAARRQDLRAGRPAAAQHLPRRDQPRADGPGIRDRKPAAAGRQDARAEVPAAASTTSSSTPGGWRSFRAWWRREHRTAVDARAASAAASPASTGCWAAGWSAAPTRC